jgi:streptogramin lyase
VIAVRTGILAALAAALAVGAAAEGDAQPRAPACAPQPVPESQGTFRIGGYGNLLAFGDGAVWALTEPERKSGPPAVELRRVDLRRRAVTRVATLSARGDARFLVAGGRAWIADPASGKVTRVTLAGGATRSVRPFGPGAEPTALAFAAGRLWVIANDRPQLAALDPGTLAVRRRVSLPAEGLADLQVAFGSIWVSDTAGAVVRIDPRNGTVRGRARLPSRGGELASAAGRLWVDLPERDAVVRIDPVRTAVVAGQTGYKSDAFEIVGGYGSLWLTNYGLGKVTRIVSRTGRVLAVVPVGREPKGIVAGGGSIWVMNAGDCSITRISPYL